MMLCVCDMAALFSCSCAQMTNQNRVIMWVYFRCNGDNTLGITMEEKAIGDILYRLCGKKGFHSQLNHSITVFLSTKQADCEKKKEEKPCLDSFSRTEKRMIEGHYWESGQLWVRHSVSVTAVAQGRPLDGHPTHKCAVRFIRAESTLVMFARSLVM